MKKSIKVLFLIICFILLLYSCDKKEKLEFESLNYELAVGETYTLQPKIKKDVYDLLFESENTSIIVVTDRTVNALSEGVANVNVSYKYKKNTYNVVLTFTVRNKKIDNVDTEINLKLAQEIDSMMNQFTNNESNNKHIEVKTNIKTDYGSQSVIVKSKLDKLYFEIINNENTIVLKEEDNGLFLYTIPYYSKISKTYLGEVKETDISQYEKMINIEQFGISNLVGIDKSEFTKENDTYVIKTIYQDLLIGSLKEQLQQIYGNQTEILNYLLNSFVELTIKVSENSYYLGLDLNTNIFNKNTNEWISINVEITQEFTYQYFDEYLLPQDAYYYNDPTCFEEIIDYTSFSEYVKIDSEKEYYFKTSLKEGVYLITLDQTIEDSEYYVEIYDSNKELIRSKIGVTDKLSRNFQYILNIPENGDYYIYIYSKYFGFDQKIKFVKQDISFNKNIIEFDKEVNGDIKSKYDVDQYLYKNVGDKNITVSVNNTGSEKIFLVVDNVFGSSVLDAIDPGEQIITTFKPGENYIHIMSNLGGYIDYNYSVKFKLEGIAFDEKIINHDFSKPLALKGQYYIKTYLEKGIYIFNINQRVKYEILVYDENGNLVNSNFDVDKKKENNIKFMINQIGRYVDIPSDGIYYLKYNHLQNSYVNYELSMTKTDFLSNADTNNPKELLSSNNFSLEGTWDLEYYTYKNIDKKQIFVKITNNSAETLGLSANAYDQSKNYFNYIESNQSVYYYLNEIDLNLVFYSFLGINIVKEDVEYNVSVEIFDATTSEFNGEVKINAPIQICNANSDSSFELNIDSYGEYVFNLEMDFEDDVEFEIYDQNGLKKATIENGKFCRLAEGKYTVKIITDNGYNTGILSITN